MRVLLTLFFAALTINTHAEPDKKPKPAINDMPRTIVESGEKDPHIRKESPKKSTQDERTYTPEAIQKREAHRHEIAQGWKAAKSKK